MHSSVGLFGCPSAQASGVLFSDVSILPLPLRSRHCDLSPAMWTAEARLPSPLARLATTMSPFRPTVVREGSPLPPGWV
jgi:hypothetical protein